MTGVLIAVGLFVFFISVYGAVMVGGHLLEELELDETAPTPARQPSPTQAFNQDEVGGQAGPLRADGASRQPSPTHPAPTSMATRRSS